MKSSREFISLRGGLSKWLSWDPAGCQIPRRLHSCICGYPRSRDGQQQAGPSPELCCVTRDSPEPALRTRALSDPEGMGHLACMWLNHPKLAVGRTLSAAWGHFPQPEARTVQLGWLRWQAVLRGYFQILGDIPRPLCLIGPRCSLLLSLPPCCCPEPPRCLAGLLGPPRPVTTPLAFLFFV